MTTETLKKLEGKMVELESWDRVKDRGILTQSTQGRTKGMWYCHIDGAETAIFYQEHHITKIKEVKEDGQERGTR